MTVPRYLAEAQLDEKALRDRNRKWRRKVWKLDVERKKRKPSRQRRRSELPGIPKEFDGGRVFLLGGGPSLNDIDESLLEGQNVIGVNNAWGKPVKNERGVTTHYEPRPYVQFVWFGDDRWWKWHREWLRSFEGRIFCCRESLHGADGRVHAVYKGKAEGIDTRANHVSWNRSSGACAINFAYHLGFDEIVLLGYDMRRVNDVPNWHDDHVAPNKNPYPRFLLPFQAIARDAKELGLTIINATPDSAIKWFPFKTLEQLVAQTTVNKGGRIHE